MISAVRGWRRKRRPTVNEFIREFEAYTNKVNKYAYMRRVNGTSYGYPQLIHKGKKP